VQELYKKEFIDYLNFRQNYKNEDIKQVVNELLDNEKIFKENDYGYMIIDLIKNELKEENDVDYNLIKSCIFEENMLENTLIDIDRLKEFALLSERNTNNKRLKSSFKELKQIEEYTFNEKRTIFGSVGRHKRDIKNYIRINDEILNSKSWKLTSYLRSIKHKFYSKWR
jgi:hypothetical protein